MTRFATCLSLVTVLGLAGARDASAADTLEPMVVTGPSENRIDLVITGDGYTAAEADDFRADASQLIAGMFARSPLTEYEATYNISLVVTESAQSGADHPSQNLYVDTYFGGYFDCANIERLTCADTSKVASVVLGLAPETDFIVLILNDDTYGGSGGGVAVVSTHDLAVDILIHELGHTVSGLADEYSSPYPGYPPGDPEPNVDFDSSAELIKWNHWIEPGTPLPTSLAQQTGDTTPIGAYVGARYLESGIHRPAPNCMMRSLGVEFCDVCREAQVVGVYNLIDPIDGAEPAPGPVTVAEATTFRVDTPEVASLVVQWLVDGEPVATGTELEIDPNTTSISVGSHTLTAVVGDQTSMVRSDPGALLTTSREWTIEVAEGDGTGPDPDGGVTGDGGSTDDPGADGDISGAGCGCQTGGGGGAVPLALVVLGFALARRRRRVDHNPKG